MRVIATRPIEKGEPVTISYGPLLSKVSKAFSRCFAFFFYAALHRRNGADGVGCDKVAKLLLDVATGLELCSA